MLEEVVVIVWVEERLDSIWTVDCTSGDVLCGIRKRIVNIVWVEERLDSIWTVTVSGDVLCGIRKRIVNNSLLEQ